MTTERTSPEGKSQGPERPTRRCKIFGVAIRHLPGINFITIHYAYFIVTILITALIFWASSTPSNSVSFVDSLFLCASAMTEAGLNTVNLSTINTFQQVMLFSLIVVGSSIFVSIFVLLVRLRAFEQEFKQSIKKRREMKEKNRASARESSRRRTSNLFRRSADDSMLPSYRKAANFSEPHSEDDCDFSEKQPHPLAQQTVDSAGESSTGRSHGAIAAAFSANAHVTSRVDTNSLPRLSVSKSVPNDRNSYSSVLSQTNSPRSLNSRRLHRVQERARRPSISFSTTDAPASSSHPPRSTSTASRSGPRFPGPPKLSTPGRPPSVHGAPTEPFVESASGFFAYNSSVYGLSMTERQQLGGCEYSAILMLSMIVPLYWVMFQLLSALALGAWIQNNRPETTRANGINPFWVGSFNAISAFNNSGMSLLDANMTAFQDSYFLLLSMGLLILAGNTAFPIFLRIVIWLIHKLLPKTKFWKFDRETLEFLLKHPRRCYTNLFPARHTWWLGACLITLNGVDWAMFEILNIGNGKITRSLPLKIEVLDGIFQALAVRSGGFYVVAITNTRIALQVLYVIMMYISVYPVAITMRHSNVYEERSLGIYAEDLQGDNNGDAGDDRLGPEGKSGIASRLHRFTKTAAQAPRRGQRSTFVHQQLRAQLSHDAWLIALAVFLIMIIEGARFESNPTVFSCFNVIFEVVSGYGCVGISIGVPWNAFSFCGAWHSLSKLILTAVMIRGRHRGLPVAIDHAVQLPGQQLWLAEEDDGRRRLERSRALHEGQV